MTKKKLMSQSLVNEGRFPPWRNDGGALTLLKLCRNPSLMRAGFHTSTEFIREVLHYVSQSLVNEGRFPHADDFFALSVIKIYYNVAIPR